MRQNRAMNESQSVVVEAGLETVRELQAVLGKSGLKADILAPPGCDTNS